MRLHISFNIYEIPATSILTKPNIPFNNKIFFIKLHLFRNIFLKFIYNGAAHTFDISLSLRRNKSTVKADSRYFPTAIGSS